MTTRRRIERLEARVNASQEEGFRERWWRAIEQAQNDNEPDPEGARLVLTGEAAAAVSVWWEAHGSTPTGNEPSPSCTPVHGRCTPS